MVPLLLRGLRERATTVKRQTCKIIDNMVQLVDDPADAECFLPMLLPGLEKASNEVADPEARTVAIKAFATLKRVSGHGKAEEQKFPSAAPKKVEQKVGMPFLCCLQHLSSAGLPRDGSIR
jgi:elongation factor 3